MLSTMSDKERLAHYARSAREKSPLFETGKGESFYRDSRAHAEVDDIMAFDATTPHEFLRILTALWRESDLDDFETLARIATAAAWKNSPDVRELLELEEASKSGSIAGDEQKGEGEEAAEYYVPPEKKITLSRKVYEF